MTQPDDARPAPDSVGGKLGDLFDQHDQTSSDETGLGDDDVTGHDDVTGADVGGADVSRADPLPKRPTDPPF